MWFVWSKTSYKGDKVDPDFVRRRTDTRKDKGVPRGPRRPKNIDVKVFVKTIAKNEKFGP